jgi:GDP-4-dehydro-6-deoxy-D-mannose reductase
LDTQRDFLDVRDVVDAYVRAVFRAADLPPGIILNVASGQAWRIGDLLGLLLKKSSKEIAIQQDPARMRPSDLPRIVGDAGRARSVLDWSPRYTMEETLAAVLVDCRARVASIEGSPS